MQDSEKGVDTAPLSRMLLLWSFRRVATNDEAVGQPQGYEVFHIGYRGPLTRSLSLRSVAAVARELLSISL